MTRQFCDRCVADVTNKVSASVHIVANADPQGNGKVSDEADLCPACYRALLAWLKTRPGGLRPGTSLSIRARTKPRAR